MKITIAAPAWPYRGGIADFSNRLAQQFIEEGHDVDIITFSLQYPGLLFPGKTQFSSTGSPHGLKIRRLINSINPLNWISTGLKIKKEKPDILLLRFWLPFMAPSTGTMARIAKSNKYTRVICIFDNVVPHEKRFGDKILTGYLVNSIDGAVVMAGAVGDDLIKFRKKIPVKLNPHPLYDNYGNPVSRHEALSRLGLQDNYRYILFFGFIRAYKGLDLLITAFADERFRNMNLKLLVAGEFYENPSPYLELIKNHNVHDRVILFDRFIENYEIPLFFGAADLVVQPYRNATQSGVTQIAYYFGKPMLVTRVGGLSEIVPHGKCGYVTEAEPSSVADSIYDYFKNNRMDPFTECVREEKKKFTWNKMTTAIIECYNNIH